jgi:hypothetical protein
MKESEQNPFIAFISDLYEPLSSYLTIKDWLVVMLTSGEMKAECEQVLLGQLAPAPRNRAMSGLLLHSLLRSMPNKLLNSYCPLPMALDINRLCGLGLEARKKELLTAEHNKAIDKMDSEAGNLRFNLLLSNSGVRLLKLRQMRVEDIMAIKQPHMKYVAMAFESIERGLVSVDEVVGLAVSIEHELAARKQAKDSPSCSLKERMELSAALYGSKFNVRALLSPNGLIGYTEGWVTLDNVFSCSTDLFPLLFSDCSLEVLREGKATANDLVVLSRKLDDHDLHRDHRGTVHNTIKALRDGLINVRELDSIGMRRFIELMMSNYAILESGSTLSDVAKMSDEEFNDAAHAGLTRAGRSRS